MKPITNTSKNLTSARSDRIQKLQNVFVFKKRSTPGDNQKILAISEKFPVDSSNSEKMVINTAQKCSTGLACPTHSGILKLEGVTECFDAMI